MFNVKQDQAYAQALAKSISSQVSVTLLRDNRKALSVNKITRVLEKAFLQAASYQARERMGFVRRSFFAHTFQWALRELAYPSDFVLIATEGLVVAISPKSVGTSAPRGR